MHIRWSELGLDVHPRNVFLIMALATDGIDDIPQPAVAIEKERARLAFLMRGNGNAFEPQVPLDFRAVGCMYQPRIRLFGKIIVYNLVSPTHGISNIGQLGKEIFDQSRGL